MPRVLLVVTDLQPGGTPLRVVRWARWLPEIGHEPIVVGLAAGGALCAGLARDGIPHLTCEGRHRFDPGVFARLARAIGGLNPDVVHSFLFHANVAARLVARLDRDRPVITSTATIEIERRWHRWGEALTGRLSTLHTVNAPSVARHVVRDLGFPPEKVVCLPNGVDLEAIDATPPVEREMWGIPDGAALIVWAGRMDPVKGLDTWIEVFDRVRREVPVCGAMVGDGPMRPWLTEALRRRGLLAGVAQPAMGRVTLPGWSDSVIGWLKSADVLLFPSRTEGNANVVLEAMACGCPVVASAVGGTADAVQGAGWLHESWDIADFAFSILRVISDRTQARAMAVIARAKVAHEQSKTALLGQLQSLYQRVFS